MGKFKSVSGLFFILCLIAPMLLFGNGASAAEVRRSLEEEVQRLEDMQEIENLMARYYWMQHYDLQGMENLYALKTPGIYQEGPNGRQEGAESFAHGAAHPKDPGFIHMHPESSPIIELADDGKTAKGAWISPGIEANRFTSEAKPFWAWAKLGADFVKEADGKWKIWHLDVYGLFMCPLKGGWIVSSWPDAGQSSTPSGGGQSGAQGGAPGGTPGGASPGGEPEGAKAGAPSGASEGKMLPTTHRWMYGVSEVYPADQPTPPTPYKTLEEKTSK
jgi:hypothetical protein